MIFNTYGIDSAPPSYSGSYSINSSLDTSQTLNTSGKLLQNDITVNPIVITRTQNQYGGLTITIEEPS